MFLCVFPVLSLRGFFGFLSVSPLSVSSADFPLIQNSLPSLVPPSSPATISSPSWDKYRTFWSDSEFSNVFRSTFRIQAISAYTSFSSISIHNNTHFSTLAALNGWSGNGSAALPYHISNYEIAGGYTQTLISISNTSVFFEITDCLLHFGTTAIFFSNVTHGTIQNCTILDNSDKGVYLYNSSEIRIHQNVVNTSGALGILSDNSNRTFITSNFIYDHDQQGIALWGSSLLNLTSNVILSSRNHGISLELSSNCTLQNNTVRDSDSDGILLLESNFVNLTDNILLYNGYYGIKLERSSYCSFVNNTCIGQYYGGVGLISSNYTTIETLNVSNSIYGISGNLLHHLSLSWSVFRWLSNGVYLTDVSNVLLVHCTILEVTSRGVNLQKSIHSNLRDISIINSSSQGIYCWESTFLNLTDLLLCHNYDGLYLNQCNNSVLTNITTLSNSYQGVYIEYSSEIDIEEVVCNSNQDGFSVASSHHISFINLILMKNDIGFYISKTNWSLVRNLYTVANNVSAAFLYDSSIIQFENVTAFRNGEINSWTPAIKIDRCESLALYKSQIFANNAWNGIEIINSRSLTFFKNLIYNNHPYGIYVRHSSSNWFYFNVFYNNSEFGLYIDYEYYSGSLVGRNFIYNNDFITNGWYGETQIYSNNWEENISYNFYDKHRLPDENADGIVDRPYLVYQESDIYLYDHYPLTLPYNAFDVHYLTSPIFTFPHRDYSLDPWEWQLIQINGTVTLQWLAALDSMGHTPSYSIAYSQNWGANWTTLVSGLTDTSYTWDTRIIYHGEILLRIQALCEGGATTMSEELHCAIDNNPPVLTGMTGGIEDLIILGLLALVTVYIRKKKVQ